jgi:hypothetical protein
MLASDCAFFLLGDKLPAIFPSLLGPPLRPLSLVVDSEFEDSSSLFAGIGAPLTLFGGGGGACEGRLGSGPFEATLGALFELGDNGGC